MTVLSSYRIVIKLKGRLRPLEALECKGYDVQKNFHDIHTNETIKRALHRTKRLNDLVEILIDKNVRGVLLLIFY